MFSCPPSLLFLKLQQPLSLLCLCDSKRGQRVGMTSPAAKEVKVHIQTFLLYSNKTVVIFIIPIVEIRKDQDFRDWQRWNLNPNSRTSLISPALFIKGCWNGSFSTSAFKLFTAASGLVSIFQIKLSIFSLDLDIHKRCFL